MEVGAEIGATGRCIPCRQSQGQGFDTVIGSATAALSEVLEASPRDALLLVENSAGMGAHLGASFEELGKMISAVGSNRLKVCLDTEHCFAAGYNIADSDGINAAMDEFDRHIGLDRLVVVHANDAKVELGSGVDRHDNIGDGYIGLEGFEVIMGHDAFRDVPFILEGTGTGQEGA